MLKIKIPPKLNKLLSEQLQRDINTPSMVPLLVKARFLIPIDNNDKEDNDKRKTK